MTQTDPEPAAGRARGSVRDAVRAFIVATFYIADEAHLDEEASLLEMGVVDSTGLLELLAFVEQQFGVRPDDGEIVPENFDGIGPLSRFIERKLGP